MSERISMGGHYHHTPPHPDPAPVPTTLCSRDMQKVWMQRRMRDHDGGGDGMLPDARTIWMVEDEREDFNGWTLPPHPTTPLPCHSAHHPLQQIHAEGVDAAAHARSRRWRRRDDSGPRQQTDGRR